ncbi:hypothetical protein [Rhodobacteraceae bacterium DSL-40]|uniref:hypothetical protein n=1 Tax=Amaricoccus sp. B4 TaxID=3368557 RepID=UPI000DAD9B3A
MNSPEWRKPGIHGALTGADFRGRVGFTGGGPATGPGAEAPDRDIAQACLASLDGVMPRRLPEAAADKG